MKKIKIGLDFDGVVAYNPFRIIRAPVTIFKRKILKRPGTRFFVPKTDFHKWVWRLLHESSVFPAIGVTLLKEMAHDEKYEFHLITARFSFLRPDLDAWLLKNGLTSIFASINSNDQDEQPHLFKERTIKRLDLDYFVEDNLDIVAHVRKNVKTKILWIYNVVDRLIYPKDPMSFPYLKSALHEIQGK